MATLSGTHARTLTGYVITMLEYPRWIIERDVDFTHCHLRGDFDSADPRCSSCGFGEACRWLNHNRTPPSPDTTFAELLQALGAAVQYLRGTDNVDGNCSGTRDCECDNCLWLREAVAFLRTHRHRS